MKRLGFAAVLTTIVFGCAPKQVERPSVPAGGIYSHDVIAADLTVEPNHESLRLSWRKTGQGPISGYNIYISERPLAALFPGNQVNSSVKSYNDAPFPGDTIPEDGVEHFETTKLRNGVRYFVTVRVVYPDRSLSRPSNEVAAVCGGRGTIELAVRHFGTPDGYSFEKNDYVRCDAVNNDLYFFSKDGRDYLASPKRLDGLINDTRFLVLPYHGAYNEVVAQLKEAALSIVDDQVVIKAGDWVLLKCGRGTHALVEVRELKGAGRARRVGLSFAYSSLPEEMLF